jgi:DNA-directed RNA polymerase subunit RPC12/RpoP
MAISFNCQNCGKKIDAPDHADGRWGKCPACHKRVYVPSLEAAEDLKLAPVDQSDLVEQKQLMAETRMIEQEILSETEHPDTPAEARPSGAPAAALGDKDLTKNIIVYLRHMVNGDLEQAETISKSIVPYGQKALEILDRIALSEIPEPDLADIPQQVLSGLIRTLRSKIT